MKGDFFMLKGIDLQLFAEESAGVNESAVAEQNVEQTTDIQQTQENTGVEQQPAAGENEGVEKAFAARLAKERERLEAEYRQRVETETKTAAQQARDSWIAEQGYEWHGKPIKTEAEYKQALKEQEIENKVRQQYSNVPDELLNELVESKRFREETLAEKKAREEKEAENKQYTDFLEAYPDVKPEDIPVEVWKEHKAGRNLLDAYVRYENQRLKDEMAKYQTQQQIEQANSKNAASSTGSAKTSGKTGGFISKEDFEANKHDMKWVQKNLSILEESRRHW